MSITYKDLTKTSYPDRLDKVNRYEDPSASDLPLIRDYQNKMMAGDIAGAQKVLTENASLLNKIINAEKMNILGDEIIALERYFKDTVIKDIDKYFMNCLQDKGVYDSEATYSKYDVVTDSTGNLLQNFICIKDAPKGTPVSDTRYWRNFTLTGKSGTGLSFIGEWSPSVSYTKDDCVSYNNCLWACLSDNSNNKPGAGDKWLQIVDFRTIVNMIANGLNIISTPLSYIHSSKYGSGLYHSTDLQRVCTDIRYTTQEFHNHIIKKVYIDEKNCALYLSSIGTNKTYMRYMSNGTWFPRELSSINSWIQVGFDEEPFTFHKTNEENPMYSQYKINLDVNEKIGNHVTLCGSISNTRGMDAASSDSLFIPYSPDITPHFDVIIPVFFDKGYTGTLVIKGNKAGGYSSMRVYGVPGKTVLGTTLYFNSEFII